MKVTEVKTLFPCNEVKVYHKDLGYAIDIDRLPIMVEQSTVTHFSAENDLIIAYCEG